MYFITNFYAIKKVAFSSHTKSINLILKVKTPTTNLQFGLPVGPADVLRCGPYVMADGYFWSDLVLKHIKADVPTLARGLYSCRKNITHR